MMLLGTLAGLALSITSAYSLTLPQAHRETLEEAGEYDVLRVFIARRSGTSRYIRQREAHHHCSHQHKETNQRCYCGNHVQRLP